MIVPDVKNGVVRLTPIPGREYKYPPLELPLLQLQVCPGCNNPLRVTFATDREITIYPYERIQQDNKIDIGYSRRYWNVTVKNRDVVSAQVLTMAFHSRTHENRTGYRCKYVAFYQNRADINLIKMMAEMAASDNPYKKKHRNKKPYFCTWESLQTIVDQDLARTYTPEYGLLLVKSDPGYARPVFLVRKDYPGWLLHAYFENCRVKDEPLVTEEDETEEGE